MVMKVPEELFYMILLEAVDMKGHLALLTHVYRLQVFLALQGALLAVPILGLPLLVQLSGHNPVVLTVEPDLLARLS
jgi:hypothetical protein